MFKEICWIFSFWILAGTSVSAQSSPSVVITEIMADPAPSVGLPEVEYIELHNITTKTISLKGWKLGLGSRFIALPDSMIAPGGYAVVCNRNYVEVMKSFGNVIGLGSFSLTNDNMQLALYNNQNQLEHAVFYQNKWWDAAKRNGGYALEMLDVFFFCGDKNNWQTSLDLGGGTPGKINSIHEKRSDTSLPTLEYIEVKSNTELILVFDKRMDSVNAVGVSTIALAGRNVLKKELEQPGFRRLYVQLDEPMQKGTEYRLSVRNIADCSGNILREFDRIVGLPAIADAGEVVINEILFHPFENGVDFVELYNQSSKFISLKNWTLGNARTDSTQSNSFITDHDVILPPHGYLALTTDVEIIKQQYPTESTRVFLEMSRLPALPNEEGTVVLRNERGVLLDQVFYSEKMHHPLLSDKKGVSLEKQFPEKPAKDLKNWQSASSTAGYATPGYVNSQLGSDLVTNNFWIEPEAFSPDADGMDDFANIRYEQSLAGKLASITIYNTGGRVVKNLLRNQLLGTAGSVTWDGTDNQARVVSTGYYFLIIDTFSIGGETEQYKCKVVVATRQR